MQSDLFIQSFLAGLSVGWFCLTYCFPFIASYAAAEKRGGIESIFLVLKFIFGRFIGYIAFGFIFGILGEKINSRSVDLITHLAIITLCLIMILYLLGTISPRKKSFCTAHFYKSKSPIMMGFLMGINICPPFLLSLGYVFSLHNAVQGILYFAIFFVASSLYFLPLFFVGLLSKVKEFQIAARISGFIVALTFMVYAVISIVRNLEL